MTNQKTTNDELSQQHQHVTRYSEESTFDPTTFHIAFLIVLSSDVHHSSRKRELLHNSIVSGTASDARTDAGASSAASLPQRRKTRQCYRCHTCPFPLGPDGASTNLALASFVVLCQSEASRAINKEDRRRGTQRQTLKINVYNHPSNVSTTYHAAEKRHRSSRAC